MMHPAITAFLNTQAQAQIRLARVGQTAVQEVLQPMFARHSGIMGLSWTQEMIGGCFVSLHRQPLVMVERDTIAHRQTEAFAAKMVGTLGMGWAKPDQLSADHRRTYDCAIYDFRSIPNDVMHSVFGHDVRITVTSSGQVGVEKL